ncbi:MAG: DUF4258 domain-containing protein [Thermoprotei archaeon]|nr:MAG: DUF4258 domain-containing protein [Thermoprotei archaeon]
MFKIMLSKHAKLRMKERNIKEEDIYDASYNPVQLVYDSWNDVYIAVSMKGIAVVYALRGNVVEILTVLGKKEYNALMSKFKNGRYKVII